MHWHVAVYFDAESVVCRFRRCLNETMEAHAGLTGIRKSLFILDSSSASGAYLDLHIVQVPCFIKYTSVEHY